KLKNKTRSYPLFCGSEYAEKKNFAGKELNFVAIDSETLFNDPKFKISDLDETVVLIFDTVNEHGMADQRRMFIELLLQNCKIPVIIKRNYKNISADELQLYSSTDLGALLLDGFGDGVWIKTSPGLSKGEGKESERILPAL